MTKKCNICGINDILVPKGSLTIQLDKIISYHDYDVHNLTWKIVDICHKCYPRIVETMNAVYEDLISEITNVNETK